MREVCLACIGFILEMTIFFAAGRLLSKALKLKEDISLQLILGYLVYFTVLEVAVVDRGTPINPNLARVQTEGGVAQGIGMALMENVQYSKEGKIRENSFMQYKIPSREDIGNIRVEFESSYEKSGPFGAKSIGELVIDTPCPAIADAVYNASGVRVRELPITSEKVAMGILKKEPAVNIFWPVIHCCLPLQSCFLLP